MQIQRNIINVTHRSKKINSHKYKKAKIVEASLIFSCLIAAAIFVVRRGQDTNWDLLNYHYYQGYSLINGRFSNDLAAANLQSFFNPIANALAYLALKHLSFPFSAWSILLIQLISIPAIALLAKEIAKSLGYSRSSPSTIPAVLLSLLAPLWISELGTTFFSSWTLPLLLWGIYLLLTAHKKDLISRNRILIAGILFGLAVGLKLTNAPFALSAIFIFAILNYQNGWRTFTLNCTFFFTHLRHWFFNSWMVVLDPLE